MTQESAEERLRNGSELNLTLLHTIPFGMEIVDETGDVVFVNKKMREIHGRDGMGKKCWMLCRDDKKQCNNCPLLSNITDGETRVVNVNSMFGGKTFQVHHTGMLWHGRKAILEMFVDMSAQTELQKLRDDLAHMVTHDMKGPLSSMMLAAELLHDEESGPLNEKQRGAVNIMRMGGKRLHNLIMDILDIKKLEENSLSPKKAPFRAGDLLADLAWSFDMAKREEKRIRLSVDESLKLVADRKLIVRILENLLSNAIKFTSPGDQISLSIGEKNGEACFEVADTGRGIDRQFLGNIFERYFTIGEREAGSTAEMGTGLGLAFCKLAVEAHGGHIAVESEPGCGSKFYFSIPIGGR